MALVTPSTPKAQVTPVATFTPSPGTWRHPKFDEITRRQNATTFSYNNVRKIIWNSGALFALWFARGFVNARPKLIKTIIPQAIESYTNTFFHLLVVLSIFNILVSLFPLLLRKDNLEDIDLTQSQRALLGLDPRDAPPTTPKTQYSTPPRYPRSSTPRSQLSGSRSGSNAASPLSRKGSPLVGIQDFASPSTPTPVSLWQKAVGGSYDASGRRNSFGSPSVLGQGWKDSSILGAPSTPSPSGTAPSVALNSKWLYTKGKISPGSRMPKIYV